jgi:hypothetical protein
VSTNLRACSVVDCEYCVEGICGTAAPLAEIQNCEKRAAAQPEEERL